MSAVATKITPVPHSKLKTRCAEINLVTYLTTGHTTTTGMLSVLSNATVASANVTTVLPCLAESGGHIDGDNGRIS
jgi:hypothetical protein